MLRTTVTAAALTLTLATSPAFAQGGGDNSEVGMCRNRLEQTQLLTQAQKDEAKKAAATKQWQLAQKAMTSGNATECLVQLDQVDRILR